MSLSKSQYSMIISAGHTNSGRIYAADFAGDMHSQSAFHRTGESLIKKGILEQSRYSNNALMNAYELTPYGRHIYDHLRADKPVKGCLICLSIKETAA